MKGDVCLTRGFVYFHGAAPDFEADAEKPLTGPHALSFEDLCWQRRVAPDSMQRSVGFESLPDEWEVPPVGYRRKVEMPLSRSYAHHIFHREIVGSWRHPHQPLVDHDLLLIQRINQPEFVIRSPDTGELIHMEDG
jgi:hypothetical protein